jgi:radical SAM superfamily enzyme
MYVNDLSPWLVFVIEVGCVFCEVQAEAEETVERQASVMIDCKSVAKVRRNLSVCV